VDLLNIPDLSFERTWGNICSECLIHGLIQHCMKFFKGNIDTDFYRHPINFTFSRQFYAVISHKLLLRNLSSQKEHQTWS
jgi:hypothetical protein